MGVEHEFNPYEEDCDTEIKDSKPSIPNDLDVGLKGGILKTIQV